MHAGVHACQHGATTLAHHSVRLQHMSCHLPRPGLQCAARAAVCFRWSLPVWAAAAPPHPAVRQAGSQEGS
eukprot:364931-Chlamydomonas_euryale.AAC.6